MFHTKRFGWLARGIARKSRRVVLWVVASNAIGPKGITGGISCENRRLKLRCGNDVPRIDFVPMRGQLKLINANASLIVLLGRCRQKFKNRILFCQGLRRNRHTAHRNQECNKQNAGDGHEASRLLAL